MYGVKKISINLYDSVFIAISIFLSIGLILILIYSFKFLFNKINQIINQDLIKTEEIAIFNFSELEKIKPILEKTK